MRWLRTNIALEYIAAAGCVKTGQVRISRRNRAGTSRLLAGIEILAIGDCAFFVGHLEFCETINHHLEPNLAQNRAAVSVGNEWE
jgi:hypothetical protein